MYKQSHVIREQENDQHNGFQWNIQGLIKRQNCQKSEVNKKELTCSWDEAEKLDGIIRYLRFEGLWYLSASIRNFQDLIDGSDCQVLAKIYSTNETLRF